MASHVRTRLLEKSGIPALWSELDRIAARRSILVRANQVRMAHSALEVAHRDRSYAKAVLADSGQTGHEIADLITRIERSHQPRSTTGMTT